MITKYNGLSADALKHRAKKLQKQLKITYYAALNEVAVENGFANWKHLLKQPDRPQAVVKTFVRPIAPKPVTVECYSTLGGPSFGKRPNTRMTVADHVALGALLQEVLNHLRYHKRAHKIVNEIILLMDQWLGYEYDEHSLSTAEFNQLYFTKRESILELVTKRRHQLRLKRQLREGKRIIERNYHDCAPVRALQERFDMVIKMMDKWPTSIRVPKYQPKTARLKHGTFVRKKGSKKLILVFGHDLQWKLVDGYGDAGPVSLGRHEVTAVNESIALSEFKPLRLYMPYGKYTCKDGCEVLYNRDYCPMWKRAPNGEVTAVEPEADFYGGDTGFFTDRTAPYYYGNNKTLKQCKVILKEWGVEDQLPLVFNRLAVAIEKGDMGLLAPKGFS